MAGSKASKGRKRPTPPAFDTNTLFIPAPDVLAWIKSEVLSESGAIYNRDHAHLQEADIAVLWAATGFNKRGRRIAGTAEQVAFRSSGWQRDRQVEQMVHWFGRVPEYLLTFDAEYAAEASDAGWCALVEHELYHIAHQVDDFGAPAFTREGLPKLALQGHDVEEFVGVVRRYGVGLPEGALSRLVRAANGNHEVSQASVFGACGLCVLRVA